MRARFVDDFERDTLGSDWHATSHVWGMQGGKLCGRDARNRPIWLKRRLPTNARIEFDAIAQSRDGDLKVEAWGDGKSGATGTSYNDATSYLIILGGWKNSIHAIARLDEHASNRQQISVDSSGASLRARAVKPRRAYHFKLERADGRTVRWLVDDIEILSFSDPKPLVGPGHEHFGFNDWAVPVCFDNLVITPLGSSPSRGSH